jgi:hypothetical protein
MDVPHGNQFSFPLVTQVISDALVILLETKHLYQKVNIDLESALAKVRVQVMSPYDSYFKPGTYGYRNSNFQIGERARGASFNSPGILLQNLKIFCVICDTAEAFTPLWHKELSSEIVATKPSNPTLELHLKNDFQIFALAYQCQICKSEPVTFLVRRHGWSFILDGRSPMEQVEVPKEIPKGETVYFRDGIIAYQSGKPLAGVLYLRVFLEAFARRQTGRTTRATGDELMDAYAQLIPPEKRSLMPSLKEWYGKLSEVIHAGREDADVFKQASEAIHRHFEFRRLFDIPDVTAEAISETPAASDETVADENRVSTST